MIPTLLSLLVGHAIADYPLQGDFLARAKNPWAPLPGVPWGWAMAAHCLIHAGAVAFITGSWVCGALEFVLHFLIDLGKCSGVTSFNQDQAMHIVCKVGYLLVLLASAGALLTPGTLWRMP